MRFRLIVLAPILLIIALGAWAFSSPVGSSPDDDHHLVSIWCADAIDANCLPGTDETNRRVPAGLVGISCFAHLEDESGQCQRAVLERGSEPDTLTARGNFRGEYPPVYYATMGLFASGDILTSALIMRFVNILLFVGISTALFVVLPVRRRPLLVWTWLITMVPLGVFLVASNNPSAWAITGVGSAWIALLGYFETTGARRITLGALFGLSVLMAAGSRADAAFFVVGAIAVVMILTFARTREYLLRAILPAVAAIVAAGFFFASGQVGAGLDGFSDTATTSAPGGSGDAAAANPAAVGGFGLLAYNLVNLPYLWTGVFGGWGLGWIDTNLPAIVAAAGTAVFVGAGFVGLGRVDWRKIVVVLGVVAVLVVMPLYVLQQGGDGVGTNLQPRYLLPLIVVLGGLLLLDVAGKPVRFGRVQVWLMVAALAIANFVSLQTNIRRYVTGKDASGLNLNAGAEWWWESVPFTPMAVWIVGTVAFLGAAVILVRELRLGQAAERSADALSSAR